MKSKKRPLQSLKVRRIMWRNRKDGIPNTSVYHDGVWCSCDSLDHARAFAAKNGYRGIKIEMV